MSTEGEDGFVDDEPNGALEDGEGEGQQDGNDADLDDAEHTDDLDGDGDEHSSDDDRESVEQSQQVRPVSRGQARIEAAVKAANEAKEAATTARRELDELRARGTSQAEADRERMALEQMDPYERLQYQSQKQAADTKAQIDRLQFQMADSADRTEFASKAARVPALAAVADDVESLLSQMRANGTTAPRETIATYVLGQRALARGTGSKTRAAKAGAARIASATARPSGARSDVRSDGPRGDTRSSRFNRLKDMEI